MKAIRYLALAICLTQGCLVRADICDISNNQLTSIKTNGVSTISWEFTLTNNTEISYSAINLPPMITSELSLIMHERMEIGRLATSVKKSFSWIFHSIYSTEILPLSPVIVTGNTTAEDVSVINFQLIVNQVVSHA